MPENKPFERNSLRDLTEERYVKKMEHIIVEEGKKLLNSLRINYRIISQKQISNFLEKHPKFKDDFGKTVWHQIKIQRLFDTHAINTFQHQLLIMMKQVLNKNSNYILRQGEFDKRYFVMGCNYYSETMNCLRDQCTASEVCPHYFKNVEGKHAKYRKYADESQKKKKEKLLEGKNLKGNYMLKETIIQACNQGDLFICPICNKEKKYACLGLCENCYSNEHYQLSEKDKIYKKNNCKKQFIKGYFKKRYLSNKIGDMDNIEKLCLEHGYTKDVANAIAMDGVELDMEMKKRGIT